MFMVPKNVGGRVTEPSMFMVPCIEQSSVFMIHPCLWCCANYTTIILTTSGFGEVFSDKC